MSDTLSVGDEIIDARLDVDVKDEIVQLDPLRKALRGLLRDEARRRGMGERARAVLEEKRGATARTVELLAPLLQQRPEVRGQRPVEETVLTSGL